MLTMGTSIQVGRLGGAWITPVCGSSGPPQLTPMPRIVSFPTPSSPNMRCVTARIRSIAGCGPFAGQGGKLRSGDHLGWVAGNDHRRLGAANIYANPRCLCSLIDLFLLRPGARWPGRRCVTIRTLPGAHAAGHDWKRRRVKRSKLGGPQFALIMLTGVDFVNQLHKFNLGCRNSRFSGSRGGSSSTPQGTRQTHREWPQSAHRERGSDAAVVGYQPHHQRQNRASYYGPSPAGRKSRCPAQAYVPAR